MSCWPKNLGSTGDKSDLRDRLSTEAPGPAGLKRTDVASRQQLNDLLAFYQCANFTLDANNRLVRDLEDI